ncbi:MAG: ATP phosphoribosyltransferase [Lewinella sp.]|jgi:ATP phosphoribosyltransferase|uniref:ATP phosphoribosyltransferase n=1 Tax=Lewinella sp. TaxID=2004506 RepID=UPI003D6B4356
MANRLKVAVQKSGRLLDDSLKLLKECGISIDNGRNQLKASARNFPIDVLYLRNGDIPQYVQDGVADIGIIGQNTVLEKEKNIKEALQLGFSKCRLSIATPRQTDYSGPQWLAGKRIATSYPNSLRQYLKSNNVTAEIHEISGSVEIAPNIGLADAICDLVSTGSTLFKNNLVEQEVMFKSQACIVQNEDLDPELQQILDKLVFRIQSVLTARKNKYLLMNARDEAVQDIINVLPGMKSPTVMPLAQSGWSSIHTVISEDRFWDIIDSLKDKGAEGILIVPIQKMIL